MTNYKSNHEYMGGYYVFGYNCVYTDILIENLENDFSWAFIGANEV